MGKRVNLSKAFFEAFEKKNPDFDLLKYDLHDARNVARLNWRGFDSEEVLPQLRTLQRVLRVCRDRKVTNKLVARGYVSAHHIASFAEHQFVRDAADLFGGDAGRATEVYRRAVHIKEGIKHVHAWVRSTVASPLYNALPSSLLNPGLAEDFKDIPSYQELFGSLDYIECEHCESIFGPAAYFVDIMRLTDQGITDANKLTIPEHYRLEDRRPDIFDDLDLTCANTLTVIPYLDIVNRILKKKVEQLAKAPDAYKLMALARYPINLPFNLPLARIRESFLKLSAPLWTLLRDLSNESEAQPVSDLDVAREHLGLSVEDLKVLTTPDDGAPSVHLRYGYDASARIFELPGDGKVNVAKGGKEVGGNATNFTTQVHDGDQIRVGGETRTVKEVVSNTSLKVESEWGATASAAAYTILPKAGVFRAGEFMRRTRIDTNQDLQDLFTEQLSADEVSKGVAAQLFINATGENLPAMSLVFDESDPGNPASVITGLSLKRLDRLNRFIRLRRFLGWSYAEVDWVIRRAGENPGEEISETLVVSLSKIQTLRASTEAEVLELAGLWSELKTTGRVSEQTPRDLFDRIFNNPALLGGQNPYDKESTVPFNPFRKPPQKWTIGGKTRADQLIAARLAAALALNDDDLTSLAGFVLRLGGDGKKSFELNLGNLSALYRHAKAASLSALDVDEYLSLLCLMYYPESPYLEPPKDAVPATIDTATDVLDMAVWLDTSGLDVFRLMYSLTDEGSPFFDPAYEEEDVRPFLDSLAKGSKEQRLKAAALASEDIDEEQAAELFDELVAGGVISERGLVTADAGEFDPATLFPLADTAFKGRRITAEQSKLAFKALKEQVPPLVAPSGEDKGILTSAFTAKTSLDFLKTVFTNGKTQKAQISDVRGVLLAARRGIDHTGEAISAAATAQGDVLAEGLSSFLGVAKGLVATLFQLVSAQADLDDYLVAFLTPIPKDEEPPEGVEEFIALESRLASLAEQLGLSPRDLGAVIDDPHHFNIEDLDALTVWEARVLSDYKTLERALNVRRSGLLDYFELPKDGNCPGPKIKKLAKVTGWDAEQICELVGLFWPGDSPTKVEDDYDTVLGLVRLQRCFEQARALKINVRALTGLTAVSRLPLGNLDGTFNEQNWETYNALAEWSLGVVAARLGASGFAAVERELTNAVNSATRDRLLGLSLWLVNKDLAHIQTPNDLYQYLLIDVQMGACMDTSRIEQAIATVQLYMQRCRMMQEPGVEIIKIKRVWWSWLSNYRVWEANRKIYLYPENYIDPTLRTTATPLFKSLMQGLAQTPMTKTAVVAPFETYLKELDVLAGLQHCGAYSAAVTDPDTLERTSRLYLIARTLTEPVSFYYRALDEIMGWGPFYPIDLSLGTHLVAPVYAYDRLFLFWLEPDVGQSSSIVKQESETETLSSATLRYSFLTPAGTWVQPQAAAVNIVARAYRNNYPSLDTPTLKELLNPSNMGWQFPYAVSLGVGFVGAGRVSVAAGGDSVFGFESQFEREVEAGDLIWCNGESREVEVVANQTNIGVSKKWTTTAARAEYRVIPRGHRARIQPFVGPGKVSIVESLPTVIGHSTTFLSSFTVGDKIVVEDETRVVAFVANNTQLVVDLEWRREHKQKEYTVIPTKKADERLMVLLGAPLPSQYGDPYKAPEIDANPGLNFFLAQRNKFNVSMYDTLRTAKLIKEEPIKGVVTMGPAFIFDRNLISATRRVTVADYEFAAADTPQPYKAVLDRDQELLAVTKSRNALADNYWGDNVAGTADANATTVTGDALPLLYYVAEDRSSLFNVGNQPGWFLFNNSDEAFLIQSQEANLNKLSEMIFFSAKPGPDLLSNTLASAGAHTPTPERFDQLKFRFARLSTVTVPMLAQRLFAGGIDNLLTVESQELPELPFDRFFRAPGTAPPPATIPPPTDKLDFDGAFGLYFKELFFHAPFLIAHMLGANKRFDEAKEWLEYIFNPTQEPDPADPNDSRRFWRYLPFRKLDRESLLKILTDKAQLARYNDRPFDPDVIADLRPSAYAKAVVMKYVDNLLEWGDLLFAQDTRETVNQATNLYVLASDLLGPRPKSVGKKPAPEPITFDDIRKHYPDGIPQFIIDLENTHFSLWDDNGPQLDDVPVNDVTSYFCVPENADLAKYWDRVEDRLFKIRNCMNIAGVVRSLALFEPPIDPRALIRALASGSGLPTLAGPLRPAIPFYRFDYLIDKAKEFAGDVMSFGSSVQGAHDSKDAAQAELLQLRLEKRVLDLTTKTLEDEIAVAAGSIKTLDVALENANFRKTHFTELANEKDNMSSREQTSYDAMRVSLALQTLAGVAETAAAINYSLPQVGSPFALTYGGYQLGNTLTAVAGALTYGANLADIVSQRTSLLAGYDRRQQDWQLEVDQAGFDIKNAENEITVAKLQLQIARQQLLIHQETIRQNEETERLVRSRFSNVELGEWLINRLSALYFQMYSIAYDIALATQQAFQFEYNTDQTFVEYGYWDDRASGLGAGESLQLALQQMDKARLTRPPRSLEIQREFSLAEIDPVELVLLKTTGQCAIRLNERLFDYDFPGHYARKIKSVAVTIDAEEGTFTGISASLVQLSNYVVMKADAEGLNAVDFLLGGETATEPTAAAMRTNWWSNQEVALSTGEEDSGVFELDLMSTSYLPFEGTGAVSTWQLTMPLGTNRFDFNAIADVTLKLQYTALNGGAKFRDDVLKLDALKPFGGAALIDVQQMYTEEWDKFIEKPTSTESQTLTLEVGDFAPPHVAKARVTAVRLYLAATSKVPGSYIKFRITDAVEREVELGPDNGWSFNFKEHGLAEPTVQSVAETEQEVVFNLLKTPATLKDDEDKYLDPEKLLDVQIIFLYDGDVKA